MGAPTACGKCC